MLISFAMLIYIYTNNFKQTVDSFVDVYYKCNSIFRLTLKNNSFFFNLGIVLLLKVRLLIVYLQHNLKIILTPLV